MTLRNREKGAAKYALRNYSTHAPELVTECGQLLCALLEGRHCGGWFSILTPGLSQLRNGGLPVQRGIRRAPFEFALQPRHQRGGGSSSCHRILWRVLCAARSKRRSPTSSTVQESMPSVKQTYCEAIGLTDWQISLCSKY